MEYLQLSFRSWVKLLFMQQLERCILICLALEDVNPNMKKIVATHLQLELRLEPKM